jgi:hypothetical protein
VSFDVSVAHEARCVRVAIKGDPRLGRLLSLLQVMEVDTASWQPAAALIDVRELQTRLAPDEQSRFGWEMAQALRRIKKIALLAPAGRMRECPGVRVFDDEDAARDWLATAG